MSHKKIAEKFLTLAARGDVEDAYASHMSPTFCHHNPYFASDMASLKAGMIESKQTMPNKDLIIQHSLEEGAFVAIHSQLKLNSGMEMAVVHLFRFEGDEIAELWDIGQQVPDDDEMVNELGMF